MRKWDRRKIARQADETVVGEEPEPEPEPASKPPPKPKLLTAPPAPPAAIPQPVPAPKKSAPPANFLKFVEQGHLPEWWAERPPLVVFSGARWVSTGGGQRPVQLAREWAETGRQILFISNPGQPLATHEGAICGNWREHLPLWLPQLAQWQGGTIYCGMPAYHALCNGLLDHWRMALDICDDWEEFVRIGALERSNWEPAQVANAFAHADLVTYSASCLEEFCKRYGARRTLLVPNGGPAEPVARRPVADMALGTGLNVVFCGALWGKWVDWGAVQRMAGQLAELAPGSVVHVIGGFDNAGHPPDHPMEPNMHCYGERTWPVALRMMAACDVAIIPFKIPVLCKAVDPNKWYDYIAARLPVVATDVMEELRGRPYTLLCKPEELAQTVLVAGAQGHIPEAEVRRITAATSWKARADALMAGLDAASSARLVRREWRQTAREVTP